MKKQSLSGPWELALIDKNSTQNEQYDHGITLPATLASVPSLPVEPQVSAGRLTQTRPFVGKALYRKECFLERAETAVITLERTRNSRLWFDDTEVGSCDSLSSPHRYVLGRISEGMHSIAIMVTNDSYAIPGGHLTSDDTQGNWNGILGEVSITSGDCLLLDETIIPDAEKHTLRFSARILGKCSFAAFSVDNSPEQVFLPAEGKIDAAVALDERLSLWDEFSPSLHTLSCRTDRDVFFYRFGLRSLSHSGRRLMINGQEAFLRGKHEALVFPNHDGLPMDTATWETYLRTVASYGFNHIRCHTCCPPEAAFECADDLGLYMEPELPFWGTIKGPEDEGYDEKANDFLFREGLRILTEYGRHPSFVMFSLGNELWGNKKVLSKMLSEYKKRFPHILYTAGSNNFQFMPDILPEEDMFVGVRLGRERLFRGSYAMCDSPQGIVQTTEPESVSDYDRAIVPANGLSAGEEEGRSVMIQYGTGVKTVSAEKGRQIVPKIPVVAHEVGQYAFYPDFDEIELYTGTLKPFNLALLAENVKKAGLWADRKRFFESAGRLAVDCYRRELETLHRTGELSGFQLLDLQDYPGQGTALVGILNALMINKGLISPEEWRRFCSDTVILAGFERFVFYSGEAPSFSLRLSRYGKRNVTHTVRCRLIRDQEALFETSVIIPASETRLSAPISIPCPPVFTDRACRIVMEAKLEDGTTQEWPLWFFPRRSIQITPDGIRSEFGFLPFYKQTGGASSSRSVIIPDAEGQLPCEYSSDFWSYRMFSAISRSMGKPEPVGTMGLCVDPADPLLEGFPADVYTTPVWYPILSCAHARQITDGKAPVQMIDNPERCLRLGVLYRQDGFVCLTSRLWEKSTAPAVNGLAWSLSRAILG
ncbi:MAG: beta-galactosidase [Clostridia bacterium]|nr:beta-galactosidase [Clostridia bacterium]